MHDFAIYDFDSKEFSLSTETTRVSSLPKRAIDVAITKQIDDKNFIIHVAKVGNDFYRFYISNDLKVEKVLIFKIGQEGTYTQISDEDFDVLQKKVHFSDRKLSTDFIKPINKTVSAPKEDRKVEEISLF